MNDLQVGQRSSGGRVLYRAVALAALIAVAVSARASWNSAEGAGLSGDGSHVELIGFGSRAGMEATVTSKQGIGTDHAVIYARLTEANARAYCEQYVQNNSSRCRDDYLQSTQIADKISANCQTGTFTTFYGGTYRFMGRNASNDGPKFSVLDLGTGQMLDGTSASGLSQTMEQFETLCPQRISVPAPRQASKPERTPIVPTIAARARAFSTMPGAIICPDLNTVSLMVELYQSHWEDAVVDQVTRGQSRLIRGEGAREPDLAAFGCALAPDGTPLALETGNVVPVVTAKLPNGTTVRGVTLPIMVQR